MNVAAILMVGMVVLTPSMALAQNNSDNASSHGLHAQGMKAPQGVSAATPRATNESDRAIDAEIRRIDHMMTICTGC